MMVVNGVANFVCVSIHLNTTRYRNNHLNPYELPSFKYSLQWEDEYTCP
jgi:hypothetical protein